MALPIKETPVLSGKDAEDFIINMENVEKASDKELSDALEIYNQFQSIKSY